MVAYKKIQIVDTFSSQKYYYYYVVDIVIKTRDIITTLTMIYFSMPSNGGYTKAVGKRPSQLGST